MNDCLKAISDKKAVITQRENLTALCTSGGFKLLKWTSNSHALLKSLPKSEQANEVKDLDFAKDALPIGRKSYCL